MVVYTCVVTGMTLASFGENIACRPYIEYVDANGITRTHYATESENVQRKIGGAYYNNVYSVAKYIVDNGYESETVRTLLIDKYIQPYESMLNIIMEASSTEV